MVDGREILVQSFLWRNFSVLNDPDGGPLDLMVRLETADTLQLPSGLGVSHAWVVSEYGAWETNLGKDHAGLPDYMASYYVSGGPKWGPDIFVDVTVQVDREDDTTWFVLVPHCLISKQW